MPQIISDLPSEVVGGLITALILGSGSLLAGPVRRRLREVLFGPRLTVHVWPEVIIDGSKRRVFQWPSLIVGLGADPINRGKLEPRLVEKRQLMGKPWHSLREFLVQPLYPLNDRITLADSLMAVHVVAKNRRADLITPDELGTVTLLINAPKLHVLDWAKGAFDEPGWDRSRDPALEGEELPHHSNWYKRKRKEHLVEGLAWIQIGLRGPIAAGDALRDALAVLVEADGNDPPAIKASVRSKTHRVPLLVKPWRPTQPGERLRHPSRTVWRRLVVASRIHPPSLSASQ